MGWGVKVQLFEVFCGREDNGELVRDERVGEPLGAFSWGVLVVGGGDKENLSFRFLRFEKLLLSVLSRWDPSLYWAMGDQVALLGTVGKRGVALAFMRGWN